MSYTESSQSNMGPFSVEAKLADGGGQIFATGAGRVWIPHNVATIVVDVWCAHEFFGATRINLDKVEFGA